MHRIIQNGNHLVLFPIWLLSVLKWSHPRSQQRQHCQPKSEPWTLEVGIDNNMLHYSEIIFDARQICWYSIGNTNMLLHWEWFFFLFGGAITNLISHQQFGYAGSKVVWAQTLEPLNLKIFNSLLIDLAIGILLLYFRTFLSDKCQQTFPLAISPSWNILLVINSGLDKSQMVWLQKTLLHWASHFCGDVVEIIGYVHRIRIFVVTALLWCGTLKEYSIESVEGGGVAL